MDIEKGRWLTRIAEAENKLKPWHEAARRIVKIYRGKEGDMGEAPRFNLHWSNVELYMSTVYAQTPEPQVERRFKDGNDPESLNLSELVQAALKFSVESYDFDEVMQNCLVDFANTGFGQIRVRYKPYFIKKENRQYLTPAEQMQGDTISLVYLDDKGKEVSSFERDAQGAYVKGEPIEEVAYEEVTCELVPWDCFVWDQSARTWNDVRWCAIKHKKPHSQIVKEFGRKFEDEINKDGDEDPVCTVWEVFDKRSRTVKVLSPDYQSELQELKDPYGLEGFFPFPKPLLGTTTTDKLVPVPYYLIVQDLFEELDTIQERICSLTEMLKVRGAYNSALGEELASILKRDDGYLHPVEDWQALSEKGGLKSQVDTLPLNEIIAALQTLLQQRDSIKMQIYEVTGFSDILRGATRASETLGAQQLKAQYATARFNRHVRKVARFIRDVFRIKAEFMAEHFSAETFSTITGLPVDEMAMQALRSDLTRAYKIDVQTDSTLVEDDVAEQEQRNGFLNAVATFVNNIAPHVQSGTVSPDLANQLLLFNVRGYRKGRQLEQALMNGAFIQLPAAQPAPGMAGAEAGEPAPAPG